MTDFTLIDLMVSVGLFTAAIVGIGVTHYQTSRWYK